MQLAPIPLTPFPASLPQLPSSSKWGQQSTASTAASQSQSAQSLSEIQKLEEEREKLSREEVGTRSTSNKTLFLHLAER